MNRGLLFVCIAMLLSVSGVYASGRYQRTEDREALIWSEFPKSRYGATWSGDRDAHGFATGYGTLTWYQVERNVATGSLIPNGKHTLIAQYSGNMTEGKLEGEVVDLDANGEIFHAKFVDGNMTGAWIAGPAPSSAQKRKERIRRAQLVEAPAEGPQRIPDQPATQGVHGTTVVETTTQSSDSLRSLTAPPSSLRMGVVAETPPSTSSAPPSPVVEPDDAKLVAALDTQYQAAVKANDAATMERILADDFVLVTGKGRVASKADLIKEAREKQTIYERQDEEAGTQKVRVWGDTAVVTAQLWVKGSDKGTSFDNRLWFSDTYIRTPAGWRYVFGQASIPLPKIETQYGVSY